MSTKTSSNKKAAELTMEAIAKEYGLQEDVDFFENNKFKIITRPGIEKVQHAADVVITSTELVTHYLDPKPLLSLMAITPLYEQDERRIDEDNLIQAVGEAATGELFANNITYDKTQFEGLVTNLYQRTINGGLVATVKMTGHLKNEEGGNAITTFGEAAPWNNTMGYPVAMAEKRALSRLVLKLTGIYALGYYGEDEADDFAQAAREHRASRSNGISAKPITTTSRRAKARA
jgi:hypothetical protein